MSLIHKNIQAKLTKNLLDLIILQLVENHPMHGYEVIITIRKTFGVTFGASTIYPLLNTMEKKRYIKCEWNMNGERPRKVYALTNDGKNLLDYTTGSLRTICRTIGTDDVNGHDDHVQIKVAESQNHKEHYAV